MSAAGAIDRLLEASVVGSFTRIGPAVRSRLDDWSTPDVEGRTVVLTGVTSGLGLAAARMLLAGGATVYGIGRNADRLIEVASRLEVETGKALIPIVADLSDLKAVRAAASSLDGVRVDALLHNAGALVHEVETTDDGIELTAAVHLVAPFLLTRALVPSLRRSDDPRVVWMTSGGMYSVPLDERPLQTPRAGDDFDGTRQYAYAKRAQVAMLERWQRELGPEGITVHAVHPGWADTPGVATSLPTFRKVVGRLLRTPEQGADGLVWSVTAERPRDEPAKLWLDREPRPVHRMRSTRRDDEAAVVDRLWSWCEELTGQPAHREAPAAAAAKEDS